VAGLGRKVQGERDEQNAYAQIQDPQRAVEGRVNDVLEKRDNQDHQNDFGQPVFEIIQRLDQQDF
jgi:hypothetical protein